MTDYPDMCVILAYFFADLWVVKHMLEKRRDLWEQEGGMGGIAGFQRPSSMSVCCCRFFFLKKN